MLQRPRAVSIGLTVTGLMGLVTAQALAKEPPQGVPEGEVRQAASDSRANGHDPLLSAMQQELRRTQQLLRLPDQPRPYFVSFWVQEFSEAKLVVRNGALLQLEPGHDPQRFAAAQARVGSYRFDSSQLSPDDLYDYGSMGDLLNQENEWLGLTPIQEHVQAIRTTLWRVTDTAYKRALVDFYKKKARRALVAEPDGVPDFSREKPAKYLGPRATAPVDLAVWQGRLCRVTAALMTRPELQDAMAMLSVARRTDYYVNTEGSVVREPTVLYALELAARAQAPDGTPLDNFRSYLVRDGAELLDEAALFREAQAMSEELAQLRNAEEFLPYTGPAILDGEVAGVFFHEALGHRLEGERQRRPEEGQTFKGKIGQRILPEFLTILDDPTMERDDHHSLAGSYRYDNEGVSAQRVVLVVHGILKNYLMSRTPVKGFFNSNGHGRAEQPHPIQQPVGRMANLLVESSHQLRWPELKQLLLEETRRQGRPYGLVIRHARSGETSTEAGVGRALGGFQAWKNQPVLVYRVDVDTGEEQLVRGVELVGTPLNSLERVIATGDDRIVLNGYCGAESGMVPVATVSPALLTAQVELQRTGARPRRPPILPSPFQNHGS